MEPVEAMSAELTAIDTRYRQIELSLNQLEQSVQTEGWNDQVCTRINSELELIRNEGQHAWRNYQSWSSDERCHPALREQMAQITGCVARCLAIVEKLEQQARLERDQLLPQVHSGVQVLRMQQAYAAG